MNAYQEAQAALVALYDDPSTPQWARALLHDVVYHLVDAVDVANVLVVLTPAIERYADELAAHTRVVSQLERVKHLAASPYVGTPARADTRS